MLSDLRLGNLIRPLVYEAGETLAGLQARVEADGRAATLKHLRGVPVWSLGKRCVKMSILDAQTLVNELMKRRPAPPPPSPNHIHGLFLQRSSEPAAVPPAKHALELQPATPSTPVTPLTDDTPSDHPTPTSLVSPPASPATPITSTSNRDEAALQDRAGGAEADDDEADDDEADDDEADNDEADDDESGEDVWHDADDNEWPGAGEKTSLGAGEQRSAASARADAAEARAEAAAARLEAVEAQTAVESMAAIAQQRSAAAEARARASALRAMADAAEEVANARAEVIAARMEAAEGVAAALAMARAIKQLTMCANVPLEREADSEGEGVNAEGEAGKAATQEAAQEAEAPNRLEADRVAVASAWASEVASPFSALLTRHIQSADAIRQTRWSFDVWATYADVDGARVHRRMLAAATASQLNPEESCRLRAALCTWKCAALRLGSLLRASASCSAAVQRNGLRMAIAAWEARVTAVRATRDQNRACVSRAAVAIRCRGMRFAMSSWTGYVVTCRRNRRRMAMAVSAMGRGADVIFPLRGVRGMLASWGIWLRHCARERALQAATCEILDRRVVSLFVAWREAAQRAAEVANAVRAAEEMAAERAAQMLAAVWEAEAAAAAKAAEEKAAHSLLEAEKRIERTEQVARERIERARLRISWRLWSHRNKECRRVERASMAAVSRLARPKLAVAYRHWRSEWTAAQLAQARRAAAEATQAAGGDLVVLTLMALRAELAEARAAGEAARAQAEAARAEAETSRLHLVAAKAETDAVRVDAAKAWEALAVAKMSRQPRPKSVNHGMDQQQEVVVVTVETERTW